MSKARYKSDSIFNQPSLKVDSENGIISDVVIVQEGMDKNYGYFTVDFIKSLIDQGNENDGVKSRFGHPNMCKTTLGTFLGRFKNFRLVEDDGKQKAIADLHLDPITKDTQVEGQGISYWEYITKMAASNPDMFGNSIHFSSSYDWEEVEVDGETHELEVYKNLSKFIASDLVDSPAATDNLFKSSDDLGVVTTRFLDENPEIFELIQKDATIIEGFFKRYANYITKQNKNVDMKNILKKVTDILNVGDSKKDIELTLANGDIVTVITDADEPAVGDKVNDPEGNPVEDGEHLLPNGDSIVTVGGAITELKDKEDDPDGEGDTMDEEPTNGEIMQSLKSIQDQLKGVQTKQESLEKSIEESNEGTALVAKSVAELTTKHNNLAKTVKSEDYTPPAGEDTGSDGGAPSSTAEEYKQRRQERLETK